VLVCWPAPCQDSCSDLLSTLLGSLIITREQQNIETSLAPCSDLVQHLQYQMVMLLLDCTLCLTFQNSSSLKNHTQLKVKNKKLTDDIKKLFSVIWAWLQEAESILGRVNLSDCPLKVSLDWALTGTCSCLLPAFNELSLGCMTSLIYLNWIFLFTHDYDVDFFSFFFLFFWWGEGGRGVDTLNLPWYFWK